MPTARLRPLSRPRRPAFFRPRLEVLEARNLLSVFTVTNLADSGTGSLRSAILSSAAGDTVQFAVSGTIALSSELQISHALTVQGANRIAVQGGSGVRAFDVFAGGVTLDGLTLTGGNLGSLQNGGAVQYSGSGTLTLSNCYVTGNSANSAGGLYNIGGTVNLVNCTFANNQAGFGGVAGAVWNQGGTLNVTNSTFSGNRSNTNEAGAIWNSGSGTTTLLNDTIAFNVARLVGGGVWNQSGTVHVKNTIIASNASEGTPDNDVAGNFDDQGHNLIGNPIGSTGFTVSTLVGGNPFALDPMLDPLANNGGPVPTLAPHSGSPALNNGDPNGAPTADERGAPRAGPTVDIGALQFGHFVVTNTKDSGAGSLRQAILDADNHPGNDLIGFALSGGAGQVIGPASDLPAVTEAVTIDGFTQPGSSPNTLTGGNNAVYGVVLDGSSDVRFGTGLTVSANGVTVRGLEVTKFSRIGISVTGSDDVVAGNAIAFNGTGGVVVGPGAVGVTIQANSIYGNFGPGIDLGNDGQTPNTPNGPQNFPVLTGFSGGTVSGSLNSTPNRSFRIEFFSSPTNGTAGQGKTFLGFTTVTTDGSGNVNFLAAIASPPAGEGLTATATDLLTGGTSEFTVNPPTSVSVAGGDGQSTPVNTPFKAPLQVVVRDVFGNPLSGVAVTFAALASGPSGSFSNPDVPNTATEVRFTDTSGVATADPFTANTLTGTYRVTASIQAGASFTFTLTNEPGLRLRLLFGGPGSAAAGTPATFTVTAEDQYGNLATSFAGTLLFTSSDSRALLPGPYAFTTGPGGDDGVHTFTASFVTSGPQTLTASGPGPIAATTSFVVQAGAAVTLSVGGFPASTPAGVPGLVTVSALDAFGNVATGYAGVLHFTSNDPTAVLPFDVALAGGTGSFSVTFLTSGVKTITATDSAVPLVTGSQAGIGISAVLLPQAVLFIPIETQQFDTPVASFTSSLSANPADYAAEISWGDGTRSAGVIRTGDGQVFTVYGIHTYPVKTDYLVDVKVTYLKTGAFETTAPSAAAVVTASQGALLAEVGFVRGLVGATDLSADNGVVDAELSQPHPGGLSATVFVARYRDNPQPAFVFGTNFYDVRVTGSGPDALLVVTFRFSEVNATDAVLRFYDQAAGAYVPIRSATRFPVVVDLATRTITVTFDATSFPKLTDLTGTVFSISVTVPPSSPQSTLSPAASLAFAGQGSGAQEVTFQPSTQLALSLVPSQVTAQNAARADLSGGGGDDQAGMSDADFNFLTDLLNRAFPDGASDTAGKPDRGKPPAGPGDRPATVRPGEEESDPDPGEVRRLPAPEIAPLDAAFTGSREEGLRMSLPPPTWGGRPTLLAAPLAAALLAGVPAREAGRRGRGRRQPAGGTA